MLCDLGVDNMFEAMRNVVSNFQGVQKIGLKVYEKGRVKKSIAAACLSGMLRIAIATQSVRREDQFVEERCHTYQR